MVGPKPWELSPEVLRKIATEKGFVIMAHNYQVRELQEIADFVGDSLQLARKACELDVGKVLFLGVDFMAEVVKALNPEKKVVVPTKCATCPMANALAPEIVLEAKRRYNAPFVAYVNSTASTKAVADYLCTSANAVGVVKNIDADVVLFGPDKNLADYVAERTGKTVIPVPGALGYCHVHNFVKADEVLRLKERYPDAEVIAHPEVPKAVRELADFVGSTSEMERYPKDRSADDFIVVTEVGMIQKLRALYPKRRFIPVPSMVCYNMKKNNLRNTYDALVHERFEITLDESVARRIRDLVREMVEITDGRRGASVRKAG